MNAPRYDGFLRERQDDGSLSHAVLHAPPADAAPSPFELQPISPMLTKEEFETEYQPELSKYQCKGEPMPLYLPLVRIRALYEELKCSHDWLLDVLFYFFQRHFWAVNGRIYVRRKDAPRRPFVPRRLICVYDSDYTFREDESRPNHQSVLDFMWRHRSVCDHAGLAVPDVTMRLFLLNLVRCSIVMLNSRGFKGVEIQGDLEAHNEAVRAHRDGRLVKREFRVLVARTRAERIMRPVTTYTGPAQTQCTRRCPSFYAHAWFSHDPVWRVQPEPHITVTQAKWIKLYQFACDLAPFLGAQERTNMSRGLDRASGRHVMYYGSLRRAVHVFDARLFPQTAKRVGGLLALRQCHYITHGGLVVCPPLRCLLGRDDVPGDDRELWCTPLPALPPAIQTKRGSRAAAALAARGRQGASQDALEALKTRVRLDVSLCGSVTNETAALLLLHGTHEAVSLLRTLLEQQWTTFIHREFEAREVYLRELQRHVRATQAGAAQPSGGHAVLKRFARGVPLAVARKRVCVKQEPLVDVNEMLPVE